MLNSKGKLFLLESDIRFVNRFEADLSDLGYLCTSGYFSVLDIDEIINSSPEAIILGLTEWDDERLDACEELLSGELLPDHIPVMAIVNEKVIRKIPRQFWFADTIIDPYNSSELEFRLSRLLYHFRNKNTREDAIKIDDITISLASYEVRVKGKLLALTLKEFELLKYLVQNRGRVFTRETLLNTIWGLDYYGGTRTVDVHIRRLRAKLGDIDETYIKTVRGVGYTFRSSY